MKNRHGMTSLLAWLLVVAMCICAVPIHGAGTQNVALPFQKAENAAADGALPERIPEEILERVRQDVELGIPLARIAKKIGVPRSTLYSRLGNGSAKTGGGMTGEE